MNTIIITGANLTREPEIRTSNGKVVAKFTVVENSFNGKEKTTYFWNCVCFGQQASFVEKFLHKGSSINITGEMKQSTYTSKYGENSVYYEIIIDRMGFTNNHRSEPKHTPVSEPVLEPEHEFIDYSDDELPFDV